MAPLQVDDKTARARPGGGINRYWVPSEFRTGTMPDPHELLLRGTAFT